MCSASSAGLIVGALGNALLQIRTPDAMLGRVDSVFSAQNMSGAAVDAVIAGVCGSVTGPAQAFRIHNARWRSSVSSCWSRFWDCAACTSTSCTAASVEQC
jgi:hypothetical protein